jgi:hypothetical protein
MKPDRCRGRRLGLGLLRGGAPAVLMCTWLTFVGSTGSALVFDEVAWVLGPRASTLNAMTRVRRAVGEHIEVHARLPARATDVYNGVVGVALDGWGNEL